jgi:hypothetical protein
MEMPEKKKILHLLKTEPDDIQRTLMDGLSEGRISLEILLYGGGEKNDEVYNKIIDLIFEYDQVITWW